MTNDTKSLRKILHTYGYKKLRRTVDEATGTVVDTLLVPLNSGRTVEIDIAPSAQTPGKLAALLRDHDARLPAEKGERNDLLEAIAEVVPERRHRYAARAGWTQDRAAFVLPHTVVGNHGELIGLSPKKLAGDRPLASKGDLEAWQAEVAAPAELSSTLLLCMSAAFAAPLLTITGEMSFGLCVFGPSRAGKSRGMLAAGSVIGIGVQDRLPSWDLTNPGLQLLLARFNHLMCPLDDLMTLGAVGRERHQWLEKVAYHLSSGQARLHSKAYDAEQGRDPAPWSTLLLTSSEKALADGHRRRQGGATVRFIDVPALLDGEDIFDRLEATDGAKRSRTVEKLLGRITKACAAHHGRAFEHYVARLIANHVDLASQVEATVARFCEHVEHPATDTAMTRDLARKFGLLHAGAALAIAAGTVPWSRANALASITAAYHAARQCLPDEALELRDGLRRLVKHLKALPSTRTWHRQNDDERPTLEVGYSWPSNAGHIAMIRTEAFAGVFKNEAQRRLVERFLIERGLVALARPRSATAQPKLKEQHVWLNGDRPRSYKVCVPWGGFYKAA